MAELHTQVWNRPDCPHTKRHWYAGGLHIRPPEKRNRQSAGTLGGARGWWRTMPLYRHKTQYASFL